MGGNTINRYDEILSLKNPNIEDIRTFFESLTYNLEFKIIDNTTGNNIYKCNDINITSLENNKWYHFCCVRNGDTTALYLTAIIFKSLYTAC